MKALHFFIRQLRKAVPYMRTRSRKRDVGDGRDFNGLSAQRCAFRNTLSVIALRSAFYNIR